MEELFDEGLARNIGLSNVQDSLLLDVLRYARIQPQVVQVEIHPYLSQEPLVELAKRHGRSEEHTLNSSHPVSSRMPSSA